MSRPSRVRRFLAASLLFCLPLLASPAVFASGSAPKLPDPGFRSVGLWDEGLGIRLDIAVWYPTQRAARDVHLEGWSFRAGKDGIPVPGLYPVILLSHNAASSRLSNHDLAAHLARHGFVVIAPTHTGDNANDTSAFFHAANFISRPSHLVLALERVSAVPALASIMDRSRIGVLGVGSGAATALQLAGALPDFARLEEYCSGAPLLDPLCSNWARLFHPAMQQEFSILMAKEPALFSPGIGKADPVPTEDTPPVQPAVAAAPSSTSSTEQAAPSENTPTPDIVDPAEPEKTGTAPKVNDTGKQPMLAVGLLTPGMTGLFPDESLKGITAQVGIFSAMNDTVYASAKATERLQTLLPRRPASRTLPETNFSDLQAPCPPVYLDTFPALCGGETPSAEDARKIRNDFFTRFYQKALGLPAPPLSVSPDR